MNTMQTIPVDLMLAMRDRYGLTQFFETGTYRGATTRIALEHFDLVQSCEISPALFAMAKLRIPKPKPPKELLLSPLDSVRSLGLTFRNPACPPTLVWCDAHWCGGPKLGPECPLMSELAVIADATVRDKTVILADDARLFLNPPPPPHNPREWPTMEQISEFVKTGFPNHVLEVVGDVIVIRPGDSH